ncbi:MAG: CBM35 domain-containing protein, partial [Clostridia bacterium]
SGTYPVENGSVTVNMSGMEAYTAYNITITKAADESLSGIVFKGPWRQTYEAENAVFVGSVGTSNTPWTYAYSGGYRVTGIDGPDRGIDFSVSVPLSGYYRADMVYGNGYGLNTADTAANNPITVTQTRSIDGKEEEKLVLENTLRWNMAGMYTDYIYLTAGDHTISIRGTSDTSQGASVDCLSLTYSGAEIPVFDSVYEAELGDFNTLIDNEITTVTTQSEIEGYSASGYITGLDKRFVEQGGGVRFVVVVPDNGLYNLTLRYSAEKDGKANIYLDNTALTTTNKLISLELPATEGFGVSSATVFLQTGINIIDVDTDGAALDYLRVREALDTEDKTVTVQAEDGQLAGNAAAIENPYSDGGKYVSGIEGGTDDGLEIKVSVPEAGEYKMVITHSNSELFGAHSYNAQIVDRYASYEVNGGEAVRLYFKNTYSNENWRTVAVPVTLNAGENTVKFYNDNWRILQCGTLKSGTTQHLPENIEYHTLVNYAPNFDSFSFSFSPENTSSSV